MIKVFNIILFVLLCFPNICMELDGAVNSSKKFPIPSEFIKGNRVAAALTAILKENADINATYAKRWDKYLTGETALTAATTLNLPQMVEMLLNNEAKIDVKNSNGKTALIIACGGNNLDIVRMLLHRGADVNVVDGLGNNALMNTSFSGVSAIDIVTELLEAGCSPLTKNYYGNDFVNRVFPAAFYRHCSQKEYENVEKIREIVGLLLTIKLFAAIEDNNAQKFKELLYTLPILINASFRGYPALEYLILLERFELIKLLFEDSKIEIKPDLLSKDNDPVKYAKSLSEPLADPKRELYRKITEYLSEKQKPNLKDK